MLPLRPQHQGVPLPMGSTLCSGRASCWGRMKEGRFCKNQREKIIAEARG